MATPAAIKYNIAVFWDDEFKGLEYVNEPFNDLNSIQKWKALGFSDKFTGDMCDMRRTQPRWNSTFVRLFANLGWKDIGTSYYRMSPGTILPTHGDLYLRYIKLFGLEGKESTIRRAIVFLEDWQSGHYFEYLGRPFTEWQAGDTIEWTYDSTHMAANMGTTMRYTLQITGHV